MKEDVIPVKIVDGANVINKIILNDYVRGEYDVLHENNLDNLLDFVSTVKNDNNYTQYIVCNEQNNHNILNKNTDKTRLLLPTKTIWIYTSYTWEHIFNDSVYLTKDCAGWKRREIVKQCTVMVEGRYIDSRRDITLKWRGSSNQRVINIYESLRQNRVVLYCE